MSTTIGLVLAVGLALLVPLAFAGEAPSERSACCPECPPECREDCRPGCCEECPPDCCDPASCCPKAGAEDEE